MLIYIVFDFLVERIGDRDAHRTVYQSATLYIIELAQVGKIRAVHSSEFLFRKPFFQMLEIAQGRYVLHSLQMEEDIILQAFYE